nr:MAG TPA: hypothetical protein [Caudoviricetes sp.]
MTRWVSLSPMVGVKDGPFDSGTGSDGQPKRLS